MKLVDVADLGFFLVIVAVMGKIVMAFRDANERVGLVAALVGENKGCNASNIGLKSKNHKIAHQANMLAVIRGNAVGLGVGGSLNLWKA